MEVHNFINDRENIRATCKELNKKDKDWRWEAIITGSTRLAIRWEYIHAQKRNVGPFAIVAKNDEINYFDERGFNVTKEVKKFLPDKKETTEEAMIAFQKWAWDKQFGRKPEDSTKE